MGSVRHRLSEPRHDCNVVLVGDCRVGKSSLVNKFINNKFNECYRATQFEKFTTSASVANRRVRYTIWDTPGSHASSSARDLAFREADVYLLCYKITDPSTLVSALNHWCPEIRSSDPDVPIVLVGCGSDLRSDRDLISALSKQGRAPISPDQALSFSHQIGAVMYVETSAKSSRSAISAFEVAGLASMGKISTDATKIPLPPQKPVRSKSSYGYYPTGTSGSTGSGSSSSNSPQDSLERYENVSSKSIHFRQSSTASSSSRTSGAAPEQFWEQYSSQGQLHQQSPLSRSISVPRTPASSRSASLSSSKTKSSTSIPSISSMGSKTPKSTRKSAKDGEKNEKMITIKCQRLNAEKNYEEIEVEVPAPIYETIQLYNDTGSLAARNKERRKSIGSKLKNLFVKN